MRRILCLASAVTLTLHAQSSAGNDTADVGKGLAIWLSPVPETVDPPHRGAWGAVTLNVKNTGTRPWVYGRDAYHRGMKVEIVDAQKNPVLPDAEWARLEELREYNHFRRQVQLGPGESDKTVLLLGHHFSFAPSTTYHIKVTWTSYAFRSRPDPDSKAIPVHFRLEAGPITVATPTARR